MVRLLAGLILGFGMPVVAAAQASAPEASCPSCLTYYRTPAGHPNLLDNIDLDAELESRTVVLNSAGYGQLYLVIFYTYATATEIRVQLSCAPDGAEFVPRSTKTLLSGGTNQQFLLSYDVSDCKRTSVTFGASNDASGDAVTVQAVGQTAATTAATGSVQ
jgi:hypothetical protein